MSWRHPATEHGYLDASYYAKIGQQLEQGCFDLMFFDDRLAMPGIYGGSVADAIKYGARPVKLDLSIVLGVLAQATSHIGLGATGSTTYYPPGSEEFGVLATKFAYSCARDMGFTVFREFYPDIAIHVLHRNP